MEQRATTTTIVGYSKLVVQWIVPCKTNSFAIRICISKYSSRYYCSVGWKHFLENLKQNAAEYLHEPHMYKIRTHIVITKSYML